MNKKDITVYREGLHLYNRYNCDIDVFNIESAIVNIKIECGLMLKRIETLENDNTKLREHIDLICPLKNIIRKKTPLNEKKDMIFTVEQFLSQ